MGKMPVRLGAVLRPELCGKGGGQRTPLSTHAPSSSFAALSCARAASSSLSKMPTYAHKPPCCTWALQRCDRCALTPRYAELRRAATGSALPCVGRAGAAAAAPSPSPPDLLAGRMGRRGRCAPLATPAADAPTSADPAPASHAAGSVRGRLAAGPWLSSRAVPAAAAPAATDPDAAAGCSSGKLSRAWLQKGRGHRVCKNTAEASDMSTSDELQNS